MNDSFVFYRSFAEGMKGVDDATYRRLMEAITWYALDGIEPELTGLERSLFVAWKANVDANAKKQMEGRKGGAPAGNQNAKRQPKTAETTMVESETTMVESKQPNENENANENENVNANANNKAPKHKHGRYAHVLLTDEEAEKLAEEYGEDQAKAAIDYLDEYIERKHYKANSHYLCIRKWVFNAMHEEEIKKQELDQREKRLSGKAPPGRKPGISAEKAGIERGMDFDAAMTAQLFGG